MKLRLPNKLVAAILSTMSASVLMTLGSASAYADTTAPAAVIDGETLGNVMYVGDSITHGYYENSWRWNFFKILTDNGISQTEEGIKTGNYASASTLVNSTYGGATFANRHSAQSSGRAWEVSGRSKATRYDGSNIKNWLGFDGYKKDGNTYNGLVYKDETAPDTFFLLIGTNDFLSDTWGENHAARVTQNLLGWDGSEFTGHTYADANAKPDVEVIYENMLKSNSNANIVMLTLPTVATGSTNVATKTKIDDIQAYNAVLKNWAATKNNVTVVEVNTGLIDVTHAVTNQGVTSMFRDGLHPNAQGELILSGNVAKGMGLAGRTAGLTRSAAASDGWTTAEQTSYTLSSGTQTIASDIFSIANGYTVDFTGVFGNGGNGEGNTWLDASNAISLTLGDGSHTGTLNLSEGYIMWGSNILYSQDNSVSSGSLRVAYHNGVSGDNVSSGYYVWLGDMLIGEALNSTKGTLNGITLSANGGEGTISNLSWTDTAYAPTTTFYSNTSAAYTAAQDVPTSVIKLTNVALSAAQGQELSSKGGEDTVIELTGVTGYDRHWASTYGDQSANIRLTDDGDTVAWTYHTGGTNGNSKYYMNNTGEWSGDGTFKVSLNVGAATYEGFRYSGDISAWTGKFLMAAGTSDLTFRDAANTVNATIEHTGGTLNLHVGTSATDKATVTFNEAVSASTLNVYGTATFKKALTIADTTLGSIKLNGADSVLDFKDYTRPNLHNVQDTIIGVMKKTSGLGTVKISGGWMRFSGETVLNANYDVDGRLEIDGGSLKVAAGNKLTISGDLHLERNGVSSTINGELESSFVRFGHGTYSGYDNNHLYIDGGSVKTGYFTGHDADSYSVELSNGGALQLTGASMFNGALSHTTVSIDNGKLIADGNDWTLNHNATIGDLAVVGANKLTLGTTGTTTTLTGAVSVGTPGIALMSEDGGTQGESGHLVLNGTYSGSNSINVLSGSSLSFASDFAVASGTTISLSGQKDGYVYLTTGSQTLPSGVTLDADTWAGTVKLTDVSLSADSSKALDTLGNANSVVELTGVTGYDRHWASTYGDQSANIRLKDADEGNTAAWTYHTGGTNGNSKYYMDNTGKWSGDGTFKVSLNVGAATYEGFRYSGDVSEWTGKFEMAAGTSDLTFRNEAHEVNAEIALTGGTLNLHVGSGADDKGDVTFNKAVKASSLSVDGTATFNGDTNIGGTVTIGEGSRMNVAGSLTGGASLAGSGAFAFNWTNPGSNTSVVLPGSYTLGADWKGTLVLSGGGNHSNLGALSGTSNTLYRSWTENGTTHYSTVEFNGFSGYLNSQDNKANIVLSEDGLTISNGSSGATRNFDSSVSGEGNFTHAWVTGGTQIYGFKGDISAWTGSFQTSGSGTGAVTVNFSDAATLVKASILNNRNSDLTVNFNAADAVMDGSIGSGTSYTGKTLTLNVNKNTTFNNSVAVSALNVGENAKATFAGSSVQTSAVSMTDTSTLALSDGATITVQSRDDRTLNGTTSLNNGTLNLYNSAACASTLDSVIVTGTGNTIETQYFHGQVDISALASSGENAADLNLVHGAQVSLGSAFNINGGDSGAFNGTLHVKQAVTSAASNRLVAMNIKDADALSNAVISMESVNNSKSHVALGIATDATVKGISTADSYGEKVIFSGAADVGATSFDSGSKAYTLTINTAGGDYTANATVKNNINITKAGEGSQTFTGDMSAFDGSLSVTGGTLNLDTNTITQAQSVSVSGESSMLLLKEGTELSVNELVLGDGAIVATPDSPAAASLVPFSVGGTQVNVSGTADDHGLLQASGVTMLGTDLTLGGHVDMVYADDAAQGINLAQHSLTLSSADTTLYLTDEMMVVLEGTKHLTLFTGVTGLNGITLNAVEGYDGLYIASASDFVRDAQGQALGSEFKVAYNSNTGEVFLAPEPATATLSLLALAGLAARRRRH